jgi:hypothetical protein
MNNEDVTPINLSSNYSGVCEHVQLSNEDLMRLTDQNKEMIYGPTLFAIKYRVLPCKVQQSSHNILGGDDDVYTFNLTGQFFAAGRGRQWNSKRKQGGMYHATRLVSLFGTVLDCNN